jgi:hypothetical protein
MRPRGELEESPDGMKGKLKVARGTGPRDWRCALPGTSVSPAGFFLELQIESLRPDASSDNYYVVVAWMQVQRRLERVPAFDPPARF